MKPWTMHHGDCLEILPTLETDSVDLIFVDPPYFRVKAEAWDRQWSSSGAFIEWLGRVADEWRRVLKPNGSLYCCASVRMSARVECMLAERFDVLNSIRWAKPRFSTKAEMFDKASMRGFFPVSEALIFCEHKGADSMAMGEAGYEAQCEKLRGFVFEPLRAYLKGEWTRAGLKTQDANEACKTATMAGHYFSQAQWALPTAEHYEAMRRYANRGDGDYLRSEYEDLRRDYEDLRRDYEDLRREYEDLRRPFNVTPDVQYTDVWTFRTVGAYPGKHPCEKPQELLQHAIRCSSKPGGVVLDTFAGGGSTGRAALALGRRFIGIEKDPEWYAVASAACARPGKRIQRTEADPRQLGLGL